MRLFVAIDVPETVKEHLSFLQRSIDIPGLRLVSPKNIHLTLNFLGEQPSSESIITRLQNISFSPFTLRLGTIGYFPHSLNPKVLWVGIDDSPELQQLQRSIDVLFTPQNSFKAHLTIARLKKLTEQEKLRVLREVNTLDVKPLSFKVNSFKLYTSTLTPLGPVYEVLEVFKANK